VLAKIYETSIISVLCSLIQHDPVLKRGIHEADVLPKGRGFIRVNRGTFKP